MTHRTAQLSAAVGVLVFALISFTAGRVHALAPAQSEGKPDNKAAFAEVVSTGQTRAAAWQYTLDNPGRQWTRPDFDDSGWKSGDAPFASSNTPGISPRTQWNSNDIFMRRKVSLPADAARLANLQLLMFHDEDAEVFINGRLATQQSGFITSYEPFAMSPEAAAQLKPGAEVLIAVHCHQSNGGQGIDVGLASVDPAVAAQLEADRVRQSYRNFALSRGGNVERGKALFFDLQRLACTRCHTNDGSASRAGPDLSTAGDKFPRPELIDAILNPSQSIAVGYNTTIIRTQSNEVFEGIVKEASPDAISLMGADGQLHHVVRAKVAAERTSNVSLMPEALQAGLSQQEFTDLVDYLETLRLPESVAASRQGMPAKIPQLETPATLRPIHPESLRFKHASWIGQMPGKPDSFLVTEHETGKVWLLRGAGSPDATKTLWLDLHDQVYPAGATGLIGGAFHPQFASNHKYYVQHEMMVGGTLYARVSERIASDDLMHDSGQAARVAFEVACVTVDHAGGGLVFGPDGYLYIGMGDTGPQRDPQGHGQDTTLLLAKMLRIDIDHPDSDKPYSIPKDNPFVGKPGYRPEIWAYGFRQPWRYSFDRKTGDLWVGDVGQDRFEEIDIVRPGENYGWNVIEGFTPFSNRYRREGAVFTPPVFSYDRRYGNSVTGGFVYRGKSSAFDGVYICGDYNSKRIWGLTQSDRKLTAIWQIATSPETVVSFAEGADGEIYVLSYEGTAYHLDLSTAKLPEKR